MSSGLFLLFVVLLCFLVVVLFPDEPPVGPNMPRISMARLKTSELVGQRSQFVKFALCKMGGPTPDLVWYEGKEQYPDTKSAQAGSLK